MEGLLTFWGLLLAYFISPFALFAFLNRLLGNEETRSAKAFLACAGLGPLALAWTMLALLKLAPGMPSSFHLWTASGIMALMIAVSERAGLQCAKELGKGMVRLLSRSLAMLGNWKSNWLPLLLAGFSLAALATVFVLCAMLPPSGGEILMKLSLARQACGSATLSSDISSSGGLLIWSAMAQGSLAEAGIAKFIFPAFLVYNLLLAACLPFKRVSTRALFGALLLLALTPSAISLNSFGLQAYALLLLIYVPFSPFRSRLPFALAIALLALGPALEFRLPALHFDDGAIYVALAAFAGLLAFAARKAQGNWLRGLAMAASVGLLCAPVAKFAIKKAAEFPLAWSVPTLPEVAIVDNSTNGRFALFSFVHKELPPESLTLSPCPWDFSYYASDRCAANPGVFPRESLEGKAGAAFVCLPPPGSKFETEVFKKLAEELPKAPLAKKAFEKDGWTIYEIKPAAEASPSEKSKP